MYIYFMIVVLSCICTCPPLKTQEPSKGEARIVEGQSAFFFPFSGGPSELYVLKEKNKGGEQERLKTRIK